MSPECTATASQWCILQKPVPLISAVYDPGMNTVTLTPKKTLANQTLQLTITALRKGAYGGSRFLLKSTLAGYTTFWVGYVGN